MIVIVRERISWMGLQVGRKDDKERTENSQTSLLLKICIYMAYVSTRVEEIRMEVEKRIPSSRLT